MRFKAQITLAVALLAGSGGPPLGFNEARAGYLASLSGGGPTFDGTNYTYTYSVQLAAGEVVSSGNFFRVYDFLGYVDNSAVGPNSSWVATKSLTDASPSPSQVLFHGDDATVPNITFTYTGAETNTVGTFTLKSQFGPGTNFKDFYGESTNTLSSPRTLVRTLLDIPVPVPEPASVISSSIGVILLGIAFACRWRKRLAAAQ
ncbi:MAG: hypothetical protein U0835_09695 [Isosphaeraceae bacterium]